MVDLFFTSDLDFFNESLKKDNKKINYLPYQMTNISPEIIFTRLHNMIYDATSIRYVIAKADRIEIAVDNAKSALIFCSPLRGLPAGKYKTWKQMTFVFDSNNLE